jgi:hypothetical protein
VSGYGSQVGRVQAMRGSTAHWHGVPILPGNPAQPCPELLTEAEAIRYLRLDTINIANPSETLRRYRDQGMLRGTQVSKRVMYRRVELDRFLERLTENNPR